MRYTKEERETLMRTDELLGYWLIETTQCAMCTRVRKIKGVQILSEELNENGTVIAGQYIVPMKSVSFRNHKEFSMKTEAERQKMSDRMKAMHAKRKNLKEQQNSKIN